MCVCAHMGAGATENKGEGMHTCVEGGVDVYHMASSGEQFLGNRQTKTA